jgi:leader peptidase (prepilin peptidase)/N-methyltransferase
MIHPLVGIVLWGLVGAAVGSFLNVVCDRLPLKGSLLRPPSRCPGCDRRLLAGEMIPIASFLALRGRCQACVERIPLRVLWVELGSAAMFAFLAWRIGLVAPLLVYTAYACILLVIMVIDLEHKLILNRVIFPAIVLALLLIPVRRALGDAPSSHIALLAWWLPAQWALTPGQVAALSQLLGGLTAFAIFFVIWLISRQGMGDGDVRLALFCGLITGFPGALVAVLGSFVLGGVVSIGLLLSGRVDRKTAIPFAPFLVITTAVVLLYGDALLKWYL